MTRIAAEFANVPPAVKAALPLEVSAAFTVMLFAALIFNDLTVPPPSVTEPPLDASCAAPLVVTAPLPRSPLDARSTAPPALIAPAFSAPPEERSFTSPLPSTSATVASAPASTSSNPERARSLPPVTAPPEERRLTLVPPSTSPTATPLAPATRSVVPLVSVVAFTVPAVDSRSSAFDALTVPACSAPLELTFTSPLVAVMFPNVPVPPLTVASTPVAFTSDTVSDVLPASSSAPPALIAPAFSAPPEERSFTSPLPSTSATVASAPASTSSNPERARSLPPVTAPPEERRLTLVPPSTSPTATPLAPATRSVVPLVSVVAFTVPAVDSRSSAFDALTVPACSAPLELTFTSPLVAVMFPNVPVPPLTVASTPVAFTSDTVSDVLPASSSAPPALIAPAFSAPPEERRLTPVAASTSPVVTPSLPSRNTEPVEAFTLPVRIESALISTTPPAAALPAVNALRYSTKISPPALRSPTVRFAVG